MKDEMRVQRGKIRWKNEASERERERVSIRLAVFGGIVVCARG